MSNLPDTSLILGWPTRLDASQRHTEKLGHHLMRKYNSSNLEHAIRYERDGHLITFAPTGSGKGVGVIIPNLLHYSGPAIVIDPKGENFAVTAKFRQKRGHTILLLDPFNAVKDDLIAAVGARRDSLNPLDLCRRSGSKTEFDTEIDAQTIADLLATESFAENPYWDIKAKALLSGLIALEMDSSKREDRSPMFENIVAPLYADEPNFAMATLLDTKKPSLFATRSISGGYLSVDAKETRDGILTTAQSYLATLTSGALMAALENSTIDLRQIESGELFTLYIVIPPTRLDSHSILLRIWITVLMHSIMERKSVPELRTLFLLDECANLGHLEILRKAVTLLRGYGLQVWMFFQDLSQLEFLYDKSFRTMVNNCGVVQAFGLRRRSASEPISNLLGGYSSEEIMRLDSSQQVISLSPGRTRIVRLFKYFVDSAFQDRFEPNPLVRESAGRRVRMGGSIRDLLKETW